MDTIYSYLLTRYAFFYVIVYQPIYTFTNQTAAKWEKPADTTHIFQYGSVLDPYLRTSRGWDEYSLSLYLVLAN